ncbi:MAG: AbrB/MazE/SpoVT family DNA-binding domain-containing protein [Opitutaceae bacterium]|nr:AbrB/MazE/SpoVT family DNA-binding domain-containing protein [Opitutaceae bacterium]
MITTVTGKNLVSIPVKIARSLGIEPGTRLEWEPTRDPTVMSVRIHPTRGAIARQLQGTLGKYVGKRESLVAKLDAERAGEDAERRRHLK